ncbi:MAG: prephenate dehydrogenase/arogenate dehydrogenase family protein [Candidatus Bathyarchaeia archaeon]
MQLYKDPRLLSESTVAIVGGTGRIGRALARILRNRFRRVLICSRSVKRAKRVAGSLGIYGYSIDENWEADIVIVSVPIEHTYQVCKDLISKLQKGFLLVDLASVKEGIVNRLEKEIPERLEYVSLHPLFGGRIKNLKNKNFIVIPVKLGEKARAFLKFLESEGANLVHSTLEEHEKSMSIVQVLHHFSLLTFLMALGKLGGIDYLKESSLETRSLEKTKKILKMIKENFPTIVSIQKYSRFGEKVRKEFAMDAERIKDLDEKSLKKIYEILSKIN